MAVGFDLPDQDGRERSLADNKGKWLVVYFYPKDDTPGCTKEACNFRDSYHLLKSYGVEIVGISKDSVESHKKFAQKYNLSFPLLSDPEGETIRAYGAWGKKKFLGKEYEGILRKTFLIDDKGEVVKVYENVNPTIHSGQILEEVKALKGN